MFFFRGDALWGPLWNHTDSFRKISLKNKKCGILPLCDNLCADFIFLILFGPSTLPRQLTTTVLAKCGKGLPLMDFAGNIKRCDAFKMPCPVDYECIGKGLESVCCKKIG